MYKQTAWQTAFAVVAGHATVKNRNRYTIFTSTCFDQAPHRSIAYHTGLNCWLNWTTC